MPRWWSPHCWCSGRGAERARGWPRSGTTRPGRATVSGAGRAALTPLRPSGVAQPAFLVELGLEVLRGEGGEDRGDDHRAEDQGQLEPVLARVHPDVGE